MNILSETNRNNRSNDFKSGCFQKTAFTNFIFPTSIKLIEANAFNECYGLKTMTFPEGIKDLTIIGGNAEGGAFSNCTNITDIYISRLQIILLVILTVILGQLPMHKVISGSDTGEPSVPGGKFLRTFSDPKYARIVPRGVKAYAVTEVKKIDGKSTKENPYYEVSLMILDVIPKNTGVILFGEPNTTSKDGKGKTLTMTIISLADEHGCIDGTTCTKTGQVVDLSLRRKNWENLADEHVHFKNYLEPSTVGDEEETLLQPYKKEADGKAYRYFGFSHYRKSADGKKDKSTHGKESVAAYDYAGFFRCKKSTIGPGKAYLKVEESEYPEPNGGEIIIPKTCQNITYNVYKDEGTVEKTLTFNYRDEYSGQSDSWVKWAETSPYWHNAIWTLPEMFGERDENQATSNAKFAGEVEFIEDEEEGTVTMIIPASMVEVEEDGAYYTLQGVKVENPTKGIYIKNGKKVIIK